MSRYKVHYAICALLSLFGISRPQVPLFALLTQKRRLVAASDKTGDAANGLTFVVLSALDL